jgi:thiosulfate reductase cytochrome b subunit
MNGERTMFPGWLRLWHWTNAAFFLLLVVTGFSIHFSGTVQGVTLRWAVRIHNLSGELIVATTLAYFLVMLKTGHWRQYVPHTLFDHRMAKQIHFYVRGILQGEHHPFAATVDARFNPLQKVSYFVVMFLVYPAQAITGLFLLFPGTAPPKVGGLGGIWPMAITHTIGAYALVIFLVAHVYLALTVAEPHTGVRAMIMGDVDSDKPPGTPARYV